MNHYYSTCNYEEDIKLTKCFLAKRYPYLKQDEDLIAMCVVRLWQKRPGYNPELAKYSTYADNWIRQTVFRFNRKRYAKMRHALTISTDTEIADGITLGDVLAAEEPTDFELMVTDAIANMIKNNEKLKDTIHHYLRGLTEKEISTLLGLAQTHVNYLLRELRRQFKAEMFFLMSESEKENQ